MNMKSKMIYVAVAILALIAIYALSSSVSTVNGTGSNQVDVEVWHYQGHDMLRCTTDGYSSVCHSPECKKCLQVFD